MNSEYISTWTTLPLNKVAKIKGGKRLPKGEKLVFENTGYPYIRVVNFTDEGSVSLDEIRYITKGVFDKIKNYTIDSSDLYISIAGTIGKSGIVPEELSGANLTENACKLVFQDNVFNKFVYYFTQTDYFSEQAGLNTKVTAMPKLALSRLGTIQLSFPELKEQKRIVKTLDQAFADIDKARAKAEKNLQNARELFDSYLHQSFRDISNTSEMKSLKDVSLDFGRGKSKHRPRNDESLYGGDYPFVQTGEVRNSEHLITTYSKTYNEKGLAQSKLWPKGTICITIAANIAETGILDFEACFPDSVIGVVVNPEITTIEYVEFLLQSFKKILQAKGKGSAQDNINMGTFENMRFPFPSIDEQSEIVLTMSDLMQSVQKLEFVYQKKLLVLEELKKSLLQKAFSGELTDKE